MNDLAKRAQANANRARAAQEPRNAPQTPTDTSDPDRNAPRRSLWLIRKADSQEVRVLFVPPLPESEVRQLFYPDAAQIDPLPDAS